MTLQIHTVVSLPFQENTYVVWRPERRDALVVDPGLDPEAIFSLLAAEGLDVAAILNTHGHGDHIAGNEALKSRYPNAPLVIGINEVPLLSDPDLNLSSPFGFAIISPPADKTVNEGDRIEYGGIPMEVLEIPGHSPGHVVFLIRESPIVVLGGDVLFQGSVGRCDFPGGSMHQLAEGIRTKLYTLPDDTIVYPGHGPETTIGQEKRANPFVPG